MFGIFTGTIVNTLAVIAGTVIGCFLKGDRLKAASDRIVQGVGLFTMVLGISGAVGLPHPVFMLVYIIIGTAIGELVDLDDKFNRFGEWLRKRFSKGDDSGKFTDSFLSGVLLFCVGSMTFMGALEAGLSNQHTIYYSKSVLDCFGSCMFAMGGGLGVGFSAIVVLLYQGGLTALAGLLAPVMTTEIVAVSTAVGSLSLLGLGMNMLGITKLKVANFLPAMFVPIVYQIIVVVFHLKSLI